MRNGRTDPRENCSFIERGFPDTWEFAPRCWYKPDRDIQRRQFFDSLRNLAGEFVVPKVNPLQSLQSAYFLRNLTLQASWLEAAVKYCKCVGLATESGSSPPKGCLWYQEFKILETGEQPNLAGIFPQEHVVGEIQNSNAGKQHRNHFNSGCRCV